MIVSRIFPFGKISFGDLLALIRQPKIFAPPAVGKVAVIRLYVAEGFEPLKRAVKRRLFQRIKSAALLFDLVYNIVTVLIPVVKASQDDRIDVPADEIGADRDALFFGASRQRKFFVGNILGAQFFPVQPFFISSLVILPDRVWFCLKY